MHLAYLDDSDTKAKLRKWQVMSGVIFKDAQFNMIDIAMFGILSGLMSPEKRDQFEEFHACELYGGYESFEGIDQSARFGAIERLLKLLEFGKIAVVYGAVDLCKLSNEVYGSANPMDISFRICVKGIQSWIKNKIVSDYQNAHGASPLSEENLADEVLIQNWLEELVILILDECPDKNLRNTLQKSFRSLRPPRRLDQGRKKFSHLHDDMYFGDSKYSVGIQLADLCSYFIARHLEGDAEIEGFYRMIEPHIVYSDKYPQPDMPLFQSPHGLQSVGQLAPPKAQEVETPDDK